MKTVSVKADQRALFVGKTRSGKTYLAEHMADSIARLVCFDPKPSLKGWDGLETVTSINAAPVRALRRGENRRIRVPDPGRGMVGWVPWYDLLWEIGDVTAYMDEINLLVHPRRNPPIEFSRLYQQGAERGIGVWASTQRPVNIPLICVTEAEWLFVFRLGNADDRKLVASYGPGKDSPMAQPIYDKHGFWTYEQSWRDAIYTKQLTKSQVTPKRESAIVKLSPDRRTA